MTAIARSAAPVRIGRFEIQRELGRGAQGCVYLALDSHLGRKAALKVLDVEGHDAAARRELVRMLLDEARIVSRLRHPNLVTLYDAAEHNGEPHLVFEFVEGQSLAERIRALGRIAPTAACTIALGALRGVASAHAMNVLHRDLKPGNIMLGADDLPRVMDFGIACHATAGKTAQESLAGTPSYMAPEYINKGVFLPASDIFAMGVVLYEMLTGAPPVRSDNPYETLDRIVSEAFIPPSVRAEGVDERLDAVVMKALAKSPAERYESAAHMAEAIEEYMAPPATGTGGEQGTVQFLLRRMRHKLDFPVLSDTLSAINRVATSELTPTSLLCNAILKDIALTTKLLKLVNAACYKQYGGSITTVSRAVTVLGIDKIRNIASSLLLMEHMQNKSQASGLREEAAAGYFSGLIATELVGALGIRDAEEAFLCATFGRLGRMLVAFYLHEENAAIERMSEARDWDASRAAIEVLGVDFDEIGAAVARSWNFPERIVQAIKPVREKVVARPTFEDDKLRILASLSNELCEAARERDSVARGQKLESITRKYGKCAGTSERILDRVVSNAFDALAHDSVELGIRHLIEPMLTHRRNWNAASGGEETPAGNPAENVTTVVELPAPGEDDTQTGLHPSGIPLAPDATHAEPMNEAEHKLVMSPAPVAPNPDRTSCLSAGVQELTGLLSGEYRLSDAMRIILETMFLAIGFKRVMLFLLDTGANALRARLGFGMGTEAIIAAGFGISLEGERDLFQAATHHLADVCVEDLDAEKIRRYVPDWYRKALPARSVLLLPLVINGKIAGLIYGDADTADKLQFLPPELNLLKTLRNQAVMAIKQKA